MPESGRIRAELIEGTVMMDLLPVGAVGYAFSGEILFFNEMAGRLWGRRPERFDPAVRFTGAHAVLRRDGTALAPEVAPAGVALRTGQSLEAVETIIERPDLSRLVIVSHVRVISDDLDSRVGAVEVFHERTAIKLERFHELEELQRAVQSIRFESNVLRGVAADARLQMNRLEDAVQGLIDVSNIAHAVAARFASKARAVDSSIRVDAPEPVFALGDRSRMEGMLGQLIDDALRHGRGRQVDLRVHKAMASAEVSVCNHGHAATFTMSLPLAP
jgi:signal transduction histidine kinase